eukprot:TRINITY_DN4442_c0_g1_i2.p1 TRINITY_DN4442_c0_g1~~TRINITY_DN4442_c0_g1_i2.p1  ORF type:complete len:382 (+),score=65.07 TRINITY_DN4442_c0_g1_i2:173-1147(+)
MTKEKRLKMIPPLVTARLITGPKRLGLLDGTIYHPKDLEIYMSAFEEIRDLIRFAQSTFDAHRRNILIFTNANMIIHPIDRPTEVEIVDLSIGPASDLQAAFVGLNHILLRSPSRQMIKVLSKDRYNSWKLTDLDFCIDEPFVKTDTAVFIFGGSSYQRYHVVDDSVTIDTKRYPYWVADHFQQRAPIPCILPDGVIGLFSTMKKADIMIFFDPQSNQIWSRDLTGELPRSDGRFQNFQIAVYQNCIVRFGQRKNLSIDQSEISIFRLGAYQWMQYEVVQYDVLSYPPEYLRILPFGDRLEIRNVQGAMRFYFDQGDIFKLNSS